MKKIRNPVPYWIRLGEVINEIADAVKHHRPRKHLQKEAVYLRTMIMDLELRREARAA